MLPGCFPKWELVYYYFNKWKNSVVIEQIHELLRDKIRKKGGSPSLALIDSQPDKTIKFGGENRGVDGAKRSKAANAILLLIPWVCSLL